MGKGSAKKRLATISTGEPATLEGDKNITITCQICFGMHKSRKLYPPIQNNMRMISLPEERIYTIFNFLLLEECSYFIDFAEREGFTECAQKQTKEYAHRYNGRIQIEDALLAGRIFERLVPMLPPEVDGLTPRGCSSNIRLYRYTPGQRFGKHIDESNYDETLNGVSKFTLLIYLNDSSFQGSMQSDSSLLNDTLAVATVEKDEVKEENGGLPFCTGGETIFYKRLSDQQMLLSVSPRRGKLLLHGHGNRCLTHEGCEVLSGVKYVLRSDVVYA